MNRIIIFIMCLNLVPMLYAGTYIEGTCGDNLTWTLKDSVLTISGYGSMYNYGSYTHVDSPWHLHRSSISTVIINQGVEYVGTEAFANCDNLTSVTMSRDIRSIAKGAFYDCHRLRSITIPDYADLKRISSGAFYGCGNLTSVTIPKDVEEIAKDAFSGCHMMSANFINKSRCHDDNRWGLTLYDEETKDGLLIKDNTALYCRDWATSVTIPKNVTSIVGAFSGCQNLTSVTIPNSVTNIGYNSFSGCRRLSSITIPYSVKSIGKQAFQYCVGLSSVTIHSSIEKIEEDAFEGCYMARPNFHNNSGYVSDRLGLTLCDEETPDGLLIDKNIIRKCRFWATSITIPNYVTGIGDYAFVDKALYEGSMLTFVAIPNSVTSIGECAFLGSSRLTSITIPNSVTSIKAAAFCGCSSLTSIVIPNSVTSMEEGVFAECSSLTSITIPNSVTSIGDGALYRCGSLTTMTIPNSVTSIGDEAFYQCSGLTSVSMAKSVKSIGRESFSGCSNLTSIFIPNSVWSIGEKAFSNCRCLTSISLPQYLTNIGKMVFSGCPAITEIYSYAETPKTIDYFTFDEEIYSYATLYVPTSGDALTKYKRAEVWQEFKNIREFNAVGISPIVDEMEEVSAYYGLCGLRSKTPTHGINIVNGHKVVIR